MQPDFARNRKSGRKPEGGILFLHGCRSGFTGCFFRLTKEKNTGDDAPEGVREESIAKKYPRRGRELRKACRLRLPPSGERFGVASRQRPGESIRDQVEHEAGEQSAAPHHGPGPIALSGESAEEADPHVNGKREKGVAADPETFAGKPEKQKRRPRRRPPPKAIAIRGAVFPRKSKCTAAMR